MAHPHTRQINGHLVLIWLVSCFHNWKLGDLDLLTLANLPPATVFVSSEPCTGSASIYTSSSNCTAPRCARGQGSLRTAMGNAFET